MTAEVEIPICQDCSFPLGGVHFHTLEIQGNSFILFCIQRDESHLDAREVTTNSLWYMTVW